MASLALFRKDIGDPIYGFADVRENTVYNGIGLERLSVSSQLNGESGRISGVELALYPHSGFWLETSEDALRLLGQLQHPRLGLCFNLCHFLKGHEGADPLPLLEAAGERLLAVTLNGADAAGEDWGTLIRPLGEGDLDLGPLLDGLDGLGYRGPVGLQAFGIREPSAAHLGRSMAAWRALQER